MFYGCTSLNYVGIPDGVTYLGSSAFLDCNALTYVILPKSIKQFGISIFDYSTKEIFYNGNEEEWDSIEKSSSFSIFENYGQETTIYFYSETQPTKTGNYWHYVDNVRTIWNNID